MSAHNSDSEGSVTDWTLVTPRDVDNGEDSSSSCSLEIVNLEDCDQDTAVAFHFKDRSPSIEKPPGDSTGAETTPHQSASSFEPESPAGLSADDSTPEILTPDTPQDLELNGEPAIASAAAGPQGEPEASSSQLYEPEGEDQIQGNIPGQADAVPEERFCEDDLAAGGLVGPQIEAMRAAEHKESDSDSDFVRLDNLAAEEAEPPILIPEFLRLTSMNSSSASHSSISSNFSFLRHSPRQPPEDDDDDSIPEDVDDRCESDISGIAGDDTDLSAMMYNIGDLAITEGNVVRSYRHCPNPGLNATLTLLALVTLFLAIGIGIGHYIGSHRAAVLRVQQVDRIKSLQDEYLMCLRDQQYMQDKYDSQQITLDSHKGTSESMQMMKTVAALKEERDQLAAEKAILETKMQWLQKSEEQAELQLKESRKEQEESEEKWKQEILQHQLDKMTHQRRATAVAMQLHAVKKEHEEMTQQLHKVQDQLNQLKIENKDLLGTISRQRYSPHPANSLESTEVQQKTLKDRLNQLKMENSDLKVTVGKIRYAEPPPQDEKEKKAMGAKELKTRLNQLASENQDLKLEVGKLKYSLHPANQQRTAPDGTEEPGQLEIESDEEDKPSSLAVNQGSGEMDADGKKISLPETPQGQKMNVDTEPDSVAARHQINATPELQILETGEKTKEEKPAQGEEEHKPISVFLGMMKEARKTETEGKETKHTVISDQKPEPVVVEKDLKLVVIIPKEGSGEPEAETEGASKNTMQTSKETEATADGSDSREDTPADNTKIMGGISAEKELQETTPAPLPPASHPVHPEVQQLKQELMEVKKQLSAERARSEMWQTLYISERAKKEKRSDGFDPNFFTCISFLMPKINITGFFDSLDNIFVRDTAGYFQKQWAFLKNITGDQKLSDSLKKKWDEFQKYTKCEKCKDYKGKGKKIFDDIQKIIASKWDSFQKYTKSGDFKERYNNAKSNFEQFTTSVENFGASVPFKEYVDKTKDTVSKLSKKLLSTWEQLKDVSNDFLSKHKSTVDSVKASVEKIKKMGERMQSKWSDMRNKMEKKRKAKQWEQETMKGGEKHQPNGKTKRRPYHKDQDDPHGSHQHHHHWHRERHNNKDHQRYDSPYHKHQDTQYEGKPHKGSKSSSEEKHEHWNQHGFGPDDFVHDGFFEGNNRKWRKHQNQFRILHGRIQRLNEDALLSMDDDDVEDLYDDLEDFQEDLEDESRIPEKLKTWLTCQMRWWKSRFHRKHRDQDLIKGCGNQMMQWQLRVLCKPHCPGKKCRNTVYEICRLSETLITQGHCSGSNEGPECHKDMQQGFQKKTHGAYNPQKPAETVQSQTASHPSDQSDPLLQNSNDTIWDIVDEDKPSWYFRRMQEREDHLVDPQWYFRRMEKRDDLHHDSSWYIKMMQERRKELSQDGEDDNDDDDDDDDEERESRSTWAREYNNKPDHIYEEHKADWLFNRALDRDFERTKPWYFKRAGERDRKHQEMYGRASDKEVWTN